MTNDPLKGKTLYLTPRQVEDRCGLGLKLLEKLRANGKGPRFVRVSCRKVLYPVDELTAWMESRIVRSTSEPLSLED